MTSTPHSELPIERAARGLRAAREFINALPLMDGASRRAIDREFIAVELIPDSLMALDELRQLEEQYEDQVREADAMRAAAMEAERRADRNQEHLNVERDANAKTVKWLNEQLETTRSRLHDVVVHRADSPLRPVWYRIYRDTAYEPTNAEARIICDRVRELEAAIMAAATDSFPASGRQS